MNFQYIPYLWLLVISAFITLFLAFFAFRYRKVKGAKAFGLSMLIFTFWTICHGLEMAGTDLSTKLFWANMQYFSYTTINITWLYMVLQFTGYTQWCKAKRVLLLLIIPAVFMILVWTDQYHGLVRYGFSMDYGGSFPVINKSYGPLYWIHPIYGYTINFIAIFLILKAVLIYKSIYRMQALALLVSPIISIVPSILYVFSLSPIKRFDITPVFLGFSGIITAIGLFRYQLFALVPVARDIAMDNMESGFLIIDGSDKVVDANLMIEKQFDIAKKDILGESIDKIISRLGIKIEELDNEKKDYQILLEHLGKRLIFEVQLLPIFNKENIQAGSIVLINDVTELRKSREEIMERNRQMAVSREREKMARDLHDNLGQVMGFINLQAQGISKELDNADIKIAADKINRLIDITKSTQNEIRKYILESKNLLVTPVELLIEIQEIIKKFEKQTDINTYLNFNKITREVEKVLNINTKTNILNIIKEALNNIRKHSKATRVNIDISVLNNILTIIIEDNGVGFDIKKVSNKENKFGLNIMKERAEEIGGKLQVRSILGEGSIVEFMLEVII